MSLVADFLTQAAERPDATAIIDGRGRPITFGSLADLSADWASHFARAGVKHGDRVLVAVPVSVRLYACLAALWRIGAVAVFPEPALGVAGVRRAVEAARPIAVVAPRALGLVLRLLGATRGISRHLACPIWPPRRVPEPSRSTPLDWPDHHPALISFTSGSTGAPKGMVRTHGVLKAQGACLAPLLEGGRGHVDLVAFPAFVLANLGLGTTSVLPSWSLRRPGRFAVPKALRQMGKAGVTRLLVPPSMVEALAGHPLPPSVRTILTGGGPVFPAAPAGIVGESPVDVVAVYGSTEAEPIAHVSLSRLAADDLAAMASGAGLLAGRPIPEVRIRIVDDEIQVSGPHVNAGYLDPAQDTGTKVRDGAVTWHRTGDAGRIDGQGRIWLLGRHAGRVGTLYPFQAEAAARVWPGVRRAALIAVAGEPALVLVGETGFRADWSRLARAIGIGRIATRSSLPMDRRHRSKVDRVALDRAAPRLRWFMSSAGDGNSDDLL